MSGPSCRAANINPVSMPLTGIYPQKGYVVDKAYGMTIVEPPKMGYTGILRPEYYGSGCITPYCSQTEGCPGPVRPVRVSPETTSMLSNMFQQTDPFVTDNMPRDVFAANGGVDASGYNTALGWTLQGSQPLWRK